MPWCEHCRDHYREEHYDDIGNHKAGEQYGPTGARIARERTGLVLTEDERDIVIAWADVYAREAGLTEPEDVALVERLGGRVVMDGWGLRYPNDPA